MIMYSDFDTFSPCMDFCAPTTSYEAPSSHAHDYSYFDDPYTEAMAMLAPISGAAIGIRAGMDAAAAAAAHAQASLFTLQLVERHGELYDPRLDPATAEYKELNGEDCEPGYDPRMDPDSDDYTG